MADPPEVLQDHFDIHASVIFRLGEDLITDEVQALVELVKNAYDADATYVKVTIDTASTSQGPSRYPDAVGRIVIEDDGHGMDREAIRSGWLVISGSAKRDMKSAKLTTVRGRTPLGDKGLGRLGAQRLGHYVEIITRPAGGAIQYYVAYSWDDFVGRRTLTSVPVHVEEAAATMRMGTRLVITGLRDAGVWSGDATEELLTALSRMISPYRQVRDFTVLVLVDGRQLDLTEITDAVRRVAHVRYRLEFDGMALEAKGKVRLALFRPENRKDWPLFEQLVERDDGERFLAFLLADKRAADYHLRRSAEEGWFVEYDHRAILKSLDGVEHSEGVPANPGPFYGEIDSFDLGRSSEVPTVFSRLSDYREYMKRNQGIRVYRDGFGIRVDQDWLKLGGQPTSGRSWYGLRPENTFGFVALTARDNASLEETTDREGFKVSPHYRNFYALLQEWLRFAARVHDFVGRGWVDFRNRYAHEVAGVDEITPTQELVQRVGAELVRASAYQKPLMELTSRLEQTAENAERVLRDPQATLFTDPEHTRAQEAVLADLEGSVTAAQGILAQLQGYLQSVSGLAALHDLIDKRREVLEDRLVLLHEAAGLGLTAEALSHEIHIIADRLALQTDRVVRHLRDSETPDPQVVAYSEHVRTTIAALRKQLAHLAPSLRYVREKRERIDLSSFLHDIQDYYGQRLGEAGIQVRLRGAESGALVLGVNRGKLNQVFDNLLLNSDYWLREALRTHLIDEGVVSIEVQHPFVRVSDNGRGIDPAVEETLFDPFVTTKGRGRGRGLGLFIVRELLDSEGCTIALLPDRNAHGRCYVFQVDMTGALHGHN